MPSIAATAGPAPHTMAAAADAGQMPGAECGSWYAASVDRGAADADLAPQLTQDVIADFCIVGGGFAGLGAALALARAGRDVRLVEAGPLGHGASGRNGGQVHLGWNQDQRWLERRLGRSMAHRLWTVAMDARERMDDLIGLDPDLCDFRAGHVHADHKRRYVADTHALVRHMASEYGRRSLHAVGRDEMRALVGSTQYHGGSVDDLGGHLHPLKLALGMARAARLAGAQLHAFSPATSITPQGGGWQVRTAQGTVLAGQVLLATGASGGALWPAQDAHILPINNFIATTMPLPPATAEKLVVGGRSVSDSRFVVYYFRLTPDRRLLFGGGESYTQRFPRDIAGFVRPHLERVFPQLAGVDLSHAWGGTLAITPDRLPQVSRPEPGLWWLNGFSGVGVVLAPHLGGEVAQAMLGRDSPAVEALRALPAPRFFGGRLLRWPTQVAALSFFALRDRI